MKVTIENLEQATEQEVFDTVALHLITQNQRCMDSEDFDCAYKNGELSCAAGCLIPNHLYSQTFEGRGWLSLAITNTVPSKHNRLIRELQKIHDSHEVENWKRKLRQLAESYELNTNVLN